MPRLAWLAISLVACATRSMPPAGEPGCAQDVTLAGTSTVGPLGVDTTPLALCLHLDATALTRAHFAAQTDYRDGTKSYFAESLIDASGTKLVDGWDVTVGQTDPQSATNVEWDAPAGVVTDVTLRISDTTGPNSTKLQLALVDPLD